MFKPEAIITAILFGGVAVGGSLFIGMTMRQIVEAGVILLILFGFFYFVSESQFAQDAAVGRRIRKAKERAAREDSIE